MSIANEQPSIQSPYRLIQWSNVRWVLLLTAILIRLFALYLDGPLAGTDQGFQLAGAQSLLHGDGFSIPTFELNDISQWSSYFITWWPPIFSYLAAPILALTHDPILTLSTWTAFGIIAIFVGLFIILETNSRWINTTARFCLWIFWIIFAPPYVQTGVMGVTDYLSLGLFICAVGLAMIGLKSTPTLTWLWLVAAGALIGLSGALRYAYAPVLVVLPASLILISLLRKSPKSFLLAIACATSTVIIFAFCLGLQLGISSSTPVEILNEHQRISQVLAKMAPFPAGAFGLGTTWRPNDPSTTPLWILSGLVIFNCVLSIYQFVKHNIRVNKDDFDEQILFYGVTTLTTIGICILLTFLSMQQSPNTSWSFIQEVRYYGPVFGLLLITLFTNLFKQRKGNIALYISLVICVFIGSAFVLPQSLDNWNTRLNRPPVGITTNTYETGNIWTLFMSEIRRLREAGAQVAFLDDTNNNWYKGWAVIMGAAIHHNIHPTTITENINFTQPITLVIFLSRDESDPERPFLINLINEHQIINHISRPEYDLYSLEIDPVSELLNE